MYVGGHPFFMTMTTNLPTSLYLLIQLLTYVAISKKQTLISSLYYYCLEHKAKDCLKCIRKNYVALSQGLPTDAILGDLLQEEVITDEQKTKIDLKQTPKEKAEYILDQVIIPSLKTGFTNKYLKFVEVMKDSDDDSAKNLATLLL